jgi:hypothetical protein
MRGFPEFTLNVKIGRIYFLGVWFGSRPASLRITTALLWLRL